MALGVNGVGSYGRRAAQFTLGFAKGATAPVSAWANLREIGQGATAQRLSLTFQNLRVNSAGEVGKNVGHLALGGLSAYLIVHLGAQVPEMIDYFGALCGHSLSFLMNHEILEATTSPDTFAALSHEDIENFPFLSKKTAKYLAPYAVGAVAGGGHELLRQVTQKEPLTPWKICYAAFRFTVGTGVLVKLGQLTAGMPFSQAVKHEFLAWSAYYAAFTIPTAFVRRGILKEDLSLEDIDTIIRKQIFYSTVVTGVGLAMINTWLNPVLLKAMGVWGSLERLGYWTSVATRGVWESLITPQLILRAEFGGDEFLGRFFRRILK
ncbi:MAG: hypothetical protein HQ596_00120 [Candidatus Saganbacteria bacterium]|nr:hypothetical protein [Candidatus Saganbacteria bacterium]